MYERYLGHRPEVDRDVWASERELHESGAVERGLARLREQGHVFETDGAVWLRWRGRYHVSGAPPLEIEGEETATFDGDRIRRLEDRFEPEAPKAMLSWMSEHGARMKKV